ncbi:hypothetical protein CK203_096110 [Vitis vinifera]|uniref:Uncharacterized protein n=1 Tax=Vitis vinifera TaxID=29760 RepID=A0A438CN49_VITVI|nr:hypothetical protein CK203_096110 [Vitis vinifera]
MVKGSKGKEGEVVRVEVRGEEISKACANWSIALSGKLELARLVGGVQLELERWSPRCGCEEEGGSRKEAWVKILGLPISLWVPSILRKVGDECGGFVAMDSQTEKMEDLEWACILVKTRNEVLQTVRMKDPERRSGVTPRHALPPHVEELESVRPEALLLPANEIDGQDSGAGGDGTSRLGLKLKSPWISPSAGRHGVAIVGAEPGDDPGSITIILRYYVRRSRRVPPLSMLKFVENGGGCWDLVEVNIVNNKDKEWERGSNLTEPQEVKGERKNGWEECNLAKLS